MKNKVDFFVVKDENSLIALKHWLKGHKYNIYNSSSRDKNNNRIIPIRWDWKPDSDWGKLEPVSGIIVIKDESLSNKVEQLVKNGRK